MKKYIIHISLALALMLSSVNPAEAQVADFVPYTRYSIDSDLYDLRWATMPDFHYVYDDYTQYAPVAVVLGLKACGYDSRTKWGGMLVSDAFSIGIMTVTVRGIKYIVNRQRPYGGNHSFPSGHTATAFMTATMLHKEYGWRSPWFSIGGYTVAALTGVSRMMNDAHWMSDVVTGAALGIGSVHLGYYLTDLIFKGKHIYDGYEKPVFSYDADQKHYVAEMLFARRLVLGDRSLRDSGVLPQRGSIAGIQTDIPVVPGIGLTARLYAGSLKYAGDRTGTLYSATAGGYWNHMFARRCEFQARAGLGYARMDRRNGMDLTAGISLGLLLDNNFKIKGLAEYDTVGLIPGSPWIHSFLIGYSAAWLW